MSLFVYNPFRVSEELTPPQLRQPAFINWLRTLLRPTKWLTDNFLNDYCNGSTASDYDNSTTYTKYDRVVWKDLAVYELRVTSSVGVLPTGSVLSETNWYKIQDNFIGADERIRYNGQLIVLEYAINKHFRVTSAPYIFFTEINAGSSSVFVEANVPIAVFNSLGSNNTARSNRIKQFIRQYTLAGYSDNVITY